VKILGDATREIVGPLYRKRCVAILAATREPYLHVAGKHSRGGKKKKPKRRKKK
jgi:hypothetical protein